MLAGCTGNANGAGEADPTSDASTVIINNYYNNSTNSDSQERIWYSSGDIRNNYWNDGQDVQQGYPRCLEYGPAYDSSTGDYLGEECKETGSPSSSSEWNGTSCTSIGGVLVDANAPHWNYANCQVTAKSISTNSGEALILYEMKSILFQLHVTEWSH